MSDVTDITDRRRVERILVREADVILVEMSAEIGLPPVPESLRATMRDLARQTVRESPKLVEEHAALTDIMMRARFREEFSPLVRKVLVELKAEHDALEVAVMKIGGRLWGWIDEYALFIRLPDGSVPDQMLVRPERNDVKLIDVASAERQSGPPLSVDRTTDPPTIAKIPIPLRALNLAEQKEANGAVGWWSWRGHLVARNAKGEVVAVWPIPEGHGVQSMFVIAIGEVFWACSDHFCMLLLQQFPEGPAAQIREQSRERSKTVDQIVAYIEAASKGQPMPVVHDAGLISIGGSGVPIDQVRSIEALHGTDLEWLWSEVTSPIGARRDGRVVAVIMPCLPNTPDVTSPGGSS